MSLEKELMSKRRCIRDRLTAMCVAIVLASLLPALAFANPVSFKDGWGIMPTYMPDWHDLQVNYSVTNRYSVGLSESYREGKGHTTTFGLLQGNYLIKRWNEMESQANVYASLGVGGRHDSREHDALAGYGGLEADYETRRIYTLLAGETLQSPNGVSFSRLRFRAGLAPYKAPIDELHTWVIVQSELMTGMDERWTVTPLLRFFLNNYAVEVGLSLEGEPFLAAMAHF